MSMEDDLTLFDATPVPRLRKGDRVRVRTIWGEETGTVVEVLHDGGFPVVTLLLEFGDTASFDVAYVDLEESR